MSRVGIPVREGGEDINYVLCGLISLIVLLISLTLALHKGCHEVPPDLESEVLALAVHGGRDLRLRSGIRLRDEHYEMIKNLVLAHEREAEKAKQAQEIERAVAHSAPGLPASYREGLAGRRRTILNKAAREVEEAAETLKAARQVIAEHVADSDHDEDFCRKWQKHWSKRTQRPATRIDFDAYPS